MDMSTMFYLLKVRYKYVHRKKGIGAARAMFRTLGRVFDLHVANWNLIPSSYQE